MYKTVLRKKEKKENIKCPKGKVLNPLTKRCVSINGKIGKQLLNTKNEKTSVACPKGTILNPLTNRCVSINGKIGKQLLNKHANIIQKNIKNLMYPFINRVSANIYDRKLYFKKMKSSISNYNIENNYCIRFYKYDTNGKPIFRIGDNIILKDKFESEYNNTSDLIYISGFRDVNKKLFKFAVRINIPNPKAISSEIITLKTLTKEVLLDNCPHYPIVYLALKCENFNDFNKSPYLTSNSNSQNSLKKIDHDLSLYPELIRKNKNELMYIILSELANGDFNSFSRLYNDNSIYLENALAQMIISLLFFYKDINAIHNNCHSGNFLFHKIKSGGYFHYNIFNKDYYIENIGFLWIISDFKYITPFKHVDSFINTDINKILRNDIIDINYLNNHRLVDYKYNDEFYNKTIQIYNYLFETKLDNVSTNFKYSPDSLNAFINHILYILIDTSIIKTKNDIMKTDIIINKKPYIISAFIS